MTEYVKIPNVFKRETFGKNKLIEGKYSSKELEYLKDAMWEFTEKIDGCLRSSTKLKLADGTDITIREVVEKKLPVEIMGYDGKNIYLADPYGAKTKTFSRSAFNDKYKLLGRQAVVVQ